MKKVAFLFGGLKYYSDICISQFKSINKLKLIYYDYYRTKIKRCGFY